MLSAIQTNAGLAAGLLTTLLAAISTLVTFTKGNSRRHRQREQVRQTLELVKLAEEAGADEAKRKLLATATRQADRMRRTDWSFENRQRDGNSLGAAIGLLVLLGPAAYGLFRIDFILTTILAWIVVAFLAIFFPYGIVQFFTGDPRKAKRQPPDE